MIIIIIIIIMKIIIIIILILIMIIMVQSNNFPIPYTCILFVSVCLKFSCSYLVYRLMFAIVCYYDVRLVLIFICNILHTILVEIYLFSFAIYMFPFVCKL